MDYGSIIALIGFAAYLIVCSVLVYRGIRRGPEGRK